ncbi:MAG: DUF3293 domain-containing protein [Trebonia sp.]
MDDSWAAYAGAVVRLETPDDVVWVSPASAGRTQGVYPDPLGRTICVVTAHNPLGRTVPEKENAAAERRLQCELERRGWAWWPAAGGDPAWTHVETSAAVIGIDETQVAALGAEFRQDAIFVFTPSDRRIVGCLQRRTVASGWSVEPEAGLDRTSERCG